MVDNAKIVESDEKHVHEIVREPTLENGDLFINAKGGIDHNPEIYRPNTVPVSQALPYKPDAKVGDILEYDTLWYFEFTGLPVVSQEGGPVPVMMGEYASTSKQAAMMILERLRAMNLKLLLVDNSSIMQ